MISVVIVNYNRKDLLRHCLDSVRGQTFKDKETIVVDNASLDGSIEMLSSYYPEVRLICNARNLLLCRTYNQGIESSVGNFVVCMNNDVILDKDYLKEAVFAIELDRDVGMVTGKILRMDGKTVDSTGLFLGRNRKPIERGYGIDDKGQYEEAGYVFGVSGSCAFFRKAMLKDIADKHGYFDERLGMYYEDLDISWRAQKRGWKAYYAPKAIVYHGRSSTASDIKTDEESMLRRQGLIFPGLPDELKKRYIKNRYLCMRKNDTLAGYILNLPFILWYDLKLRLYMLFKKIAVFE